jgi:hypothetical protein
MSVTTSAAPVAAKQREHAQLERMLGEGYGPGAWHGPDLKAALAEVSAALAFWRPAPERHNIAEIALHHAYTTRNVRAQLTGKPVEPFVREGEDWFVLSGESDLPWSKIQNVVATEQERLVAALGDVPDSRTAEERFNLILGITCHAVYHAGQIQLLKRLHAG